MQYFQSRTTTEQRFSWHDLTNGAIDSLYDSYEDGQNMSYYYSGVSGEAIDERGTIDSSFSTLRNLGTDNWSSVQVAQNSGSLLAIRDQAHNGIDMTETYPATVGTISYSTLSIPSSNTGTFTDTWGASGQVG